MGDIDPAEWAERVKGPGQYEGEPAWVAFAWEEIVLLGCARTEEEIDGYEVSFVDLDDEIRAAFPDAPEHAALYQRDDGFVCRADYDRCMRIVAESQGDESDESE